MHICIPNLVCIVCWVKCLHDSPTIQTFIQECDWWLIYPTRNTIIIYAKPNRCLLHHTLIFLANIGKSHNSLLIGLELMKNASFKWCVSWYFLSIRSACLLPSPFTQLKANSKKPNKMLQSCVYMYPVFSRNWEFFTGGQIYVTWTLFNFLQLLIKTIPMVRWAIKYHNKFCVGQTPCYIGFSLSLWFS